MPLSWTLDAARRRLDVEVVDPCPFPDWQDGVRAIFAGGLGPGFTVMVDRRQATPPRTEDVERMAAFIESHHFRLVGLRVAVVVSTSQQYMRARLLTTYTDWTSGCVIEVFPDYAEAEWWLSRGQYG